MGCYFIVTIDKNQPEKEEMYAEYVAKVRPNVEQYGGEYLVRATEVTPMFGDWHPDKVLVLRFKDREAFACWYNSPEYQAIKHLREESVYSRGLLVDGV